MTRGVLLALIQSESGHGRSVALSAPSSEVAIGSGRQLLVSRLIRSGIGVKDSATASVALGEAARSLTEPQLYSIIGVATLVILAAYLLRHWWLPDTWTAISE